MIPVGINSYPSVKTFQKYTYDHTQLNQILQYLIKASIHILILLDFMFFFDAVHHMEDNKVYSFWKEAIIINKFIYSFSKYDRYELFQYTF